MMTGIIVLSVVLALMGWVIAAYNGMVQLKIRSNNAWSDIDVQLKRRYDVIPNIVSTVEGYAQHEKTTFQTVVDARAKAMNTSGVTQKGGAEGSLSHSLHSLFAVVEKYPELKANESFINLQTILVEIEETIESARRYYNAVVRDYNTMIQMFPASIVASLFHFKNREFFQLNAPDVERKAPEVDIDA